MINDRENAKGNACTRKFREIVRRSVTPRIKNYNKYINDFIRASRLRLHVASGRTMVAGCSRSPRFLSFSFFLGDTRTHTHTHAYTEKHTYRRAEHKSSSVRRIINSCTRIGVSSRMARETRRTAGLTRRDRTSSRSVWCPAHVREAARSTYCSDVAFHLTHRDPLSNLARVIPLCPWDTGLTLPLPR